MTDLSDCSEVAVGIEMGGEGHRGHVPHQKIADPCIFQGSQCDTTCVPPYTVHVYIPTMPHWWCARETMERVTLWLYGAA